MDFTINFHGVTYKSAINYYALMSNMTVISVSLTDKNIEDLDKFQKMLGLAKEHGEMLKEAYKKKGAFNPYEGLSHGLRQIG